MSSKSILKKTAANEDVAFVDDTKVDETNIVVYDDFVSTEQDGGGISGTKKLQIKKKNLLLLVPVLLLVQVLVPVLMPVNRY